MIDCDDFRIRLCGPSGDMETWTVIFRPLKEMAKVNFDRFELTIDSKLKFGSDNFLSTLVHEIVHVTTGQVGSEELAINTEENFLRVWKRLKRKFRD